jgi:hypothetical protein
MLVLKVLGRHRFSHNLVDFQLFVYISFWFGFKAMRQDGKEIETQKVLEFTIIKAIEEVNILQLSLVINQ